MLTPKQAEALYRKLDAAMAKAVEAGWYPSPDHYVGDGSCCALGAMDIVSDGYAMKFAQSLDRMVHHGVSAGFGDYGVGYTDPLAYAIGQRLAKRWLSEAA